MHLLISHECSTYAPVLSARISLNSYQYYNNYNCCDALRFLYLMDGLIFCQVNVSSPYTNNLMAKMPAGSSRDIVILEALLHL